MSQRLGNGPGFQVVGAHTGHQKLPFAEQHIIRSPPDLLTKAQAGTVQCDYIGADHQLVIQTCRRVITRFGRMHDEQQALTGKRRLGITQLTQALGTSPLHKFEVVDVVDDAARVGVFVIDPAMVAERLDSVLRAHTLVLGLRLANPAW